MTLRIPAKIAKVLPFKNSPVKMSYILPFTPLIPIPLFIYGLDSVYLFAGIALSLIVTAGSLLATFSPVGHTLTTAPYEYAEESDGPTAPTELESANSVLDSILRLNHIEDQYEIRELLNGKYLFVNLTSRNVYYIQGGEIGSRMLDGNYVCRGFYDTIPDLMKDLNEIFARKGY